MFFITNCDHLKRSHYRETLFNHFKCLTQSVEKMNINKTVDGKNNIRYGIPNFANKTLANLRKFHGLLSFVTEEYKCCWRSSGLPPAFSWKSYCRDVETPIQHYSLSFVFFCDQERIYLEDVLLIYRFLLKLIDIVCGIVFSELRN